MNNWLLADNSTFRSIDAEHIKLVKSKDIPLGIYNYGFNPLIGSWGEKFNMSLPDENVKIYGKAQQIADHCCKAWELTRKQDPNQNLGILFSGGKGLGKSLTSKLIIRELSKKYPILIVKSFTGDLVDFLSKLEGFVIFIDEFEKIISNRTSEDKAGPSSQDTFLSLLDGVTDGKGNLFIFTANDLHQVNDYLLSRPGRIRYHYRFESAKEKLIRDYCTDNLDNKEKIEELTESLAATRFVSIDIIKAAVDEVNMFPDDPIDDCLERLNIEVSHVVADLEVTYRHIPTGIVVTDKYRLEYRPGVIDDAYCSEPYTANKEDEKKLYGYYGLNPDSDELDIGRIGYRIKGTKRLPRTGSITLDKSNLAWVSNDGHEADFEILGATLTDSFAFRNSFFYSDYSDM